MDSRPPNVRDMDVIIVGAGFSGLLCCLKLKKLGLERIVVLERGNRPGGTWAFNLYPGVACDVRSYHYLPLHYVDVKSYLPPRTYCTGQEILDFIDLLVKTNDLEKHIEFSKNVIKMVYDNSTKKWIITTMKGEILKSRFIITANGPLSQPKMPDVKGLHQFKGIALHTSRYDPNISLKGLSVGVIGTGASAVQVIPKVAQTAKHLYVFQRTPAYCWPREECPLPTKIRNRIYEGGEQAIREFRYRFNNYWDDYILPKVWNVDEMNSRECERLRDRIRKIVKDPQTAEALCPYYPIGCKRVTVTDDYWPTFNRDNVTLIADKGGAAEITETGIITAQGRHISKLDAIIFATGFDAANGYFNVIEVKGKDGRQLSNVYKDGPRTLFGMMTYGFPNMFIMCGPQGFNSHINTTEIIDVQSDWIAFVIENMLRQDNCSIIEAKKRAEDYWVDWCRELGKRSVLSKCNSWYNAEGDGVFTYAGSWWDYIASLMTDMDEVLDFTCSGEKKRIFRRRFVPKHAQLPTNIIPRPLL